MLCLHACMKTLSCTWYCLLWWYVPLEIFVSLKPLFRPAKRPKPTYTPCNPILKYVIFVIVSIYESTLVISCLLIQTNEACRSAQLLFHPFCNLSNAKDGTPSTSGLPYITPAPSSPPPPFLYPLPDLQIEFSGVVLSFW